ncbi:calcitonin gene-related peptide type 1 receptor-like [Lampetra fluviatilis]
MEHRLAFLNFIILISKWPPGSEALNGSRLATPPAVAVVPEEETEAAMAMVPVGEEQYIVKAQYECYMKILRDPPYNGSGPYCNRTWDGWRCWDDTLAGTEVSQKCPDYFEDFDPSEKVTKICNKDGNWFRHPESNRTWSNYTLCNAHTHDMLKMAMNLYYLAVIGHTLSIVSLSTSLFIFFYFRSLSCQRITLHKNLFSSYILNSVITIISLTVVANNRQLVASNPVECKVLQFLQQYLNGCNYFWMLCEGIYLHTLIVVAVFSEKQHLVWYYLLGWVFPLVPAVIHAVARSVYYNDKCWISSETYLLYIIHAPYIIALLVNLFFLLNIVRVLVTKLKDTHRAESNMYMKAVRATLILVPLLGIQFVLVPWRPEGRLAGEVYDYLMHLVMHYQGLLVATIFCFFNGEVQTVLRRHWMQYRLRFGHRRRVEHCSVRSTSYSTTGSVGDAPLPASYAFVKAGNGQARSCNGAVAGAVGASGAGGVGGVGGGGGSGGGGVSGGGKRTVNSELLALKLNETKA